MDKIIAYVKALFGRIAQKIFTRDDVHEFKPTIAEIEEKPANPLGRIIFWVIIATLVFFGIWTCLGKVDVVVTARGIVIPEGDVKILQPLDTGVVSSILCREGDYVKKDQVLMEIDPSTTAPELESKKKNLQFTELEKERLQASLGRKGFNPEAGKHDAESVRAQKELYRASLTSLDQQLQAKRAELGRIDEEIRGAEKEKAFNQAQLAVAADREKRLKEVVDIIARNDYEKALSDVMSYANAVEQLTHKCEQLNQQKKQLAHELTYINASFKTNTLKEYSDKHKVSTEMRAEIDKTAFRNEKQRIVAPVNGYVTNLFFHTIGGVVTPAQKLIAVVPIGAPLVIKTTVLNKDIGFVKEGMQVMVKIDTFDFQKYGIINATVRSVAKHSIEDEKLGPVYEVFVTPIDTHLVVEKKRVPITSGMSVTAEIKVSRRRIIEFFVYPIIKYLDEGIKVR